MLVSGVLERALETDCTWITTALDDLSEAVAEFELII